LKLNFLISSILPSGVIMYQYDLILDSDSNAVDVFSLDDFLEIKYINMAGI